MTYSTWYDSDWWIYFDECVGDKIGDMILSIQLRQGYVFKLYYSTIDGKNLRGMRAWLRYETGCDGGQIEELMMCIEEWVMDLKEEFNNE
jgi:hypothetical protein